MATGEAEKPWLGPFCKLYRANEHLRTLDAELLKVLQPGCYEVNDSFGDLGSEGNRVRQLFRRSVSFKEALPLLRWGTIMGNVVQDLRSALDHMVFAISFARNPTEFNADRSTAFPICDTEENYNGPRWRHALRGLPDEVEAVIRGVQPFQHGDVQNDLLWALRELSNIDKHKSIHLTAWSAHSIDLKVFDLGPGVHLHRQWVRDKGPISSGDALFEIEYSVPSSPDQVSGIYFDKEYYFTVVFGEDTPLAGKQVQQALFEVAVYVEGILNALADNAG